ncbi:MAG TPA: pilus assembly protein TadG-related protein, partial [Chloroflexota bacterium]
MGNWRLGREDGQILIIVATAFFFVLVGAAATTVDLGNGMVQQRRLQNVSDAAAVAAAAELSRGSSASTAISVARDVVSSNTGGAVTIPATNTGSGTGLTAGIEVNTLSNGTEVRVALQRQVSTYLAGAIGVKTMNVHARSRAGTAYQGIMPVAVKRFSAGDTSMAIDYSSNSPTANPRKGEVWDAVANVSTGMIGQWPSPTLSQSANSDVPRSPSNTAVAAAAGSTICDPTTAGPVVPFLGRDALANVANGNDFHFWIAPDIRNLTSMSPTYTNGVTGDTSAQNLKNLESTYFTQGGY